ncbi:amidase [uncultured Ruegeria sp.]|uniref:amidase n=1 Tax=uncultured Ruegeria sp. TaxID=259304 RepID=UPI0026147215|nr:amidase [uncultured Ruegeria sp.]
MQREISVEELIGASLRRAEEAQAKFNCFTEIHHEQALSAARSADNLLARNDASGALFGLPVSIKDFTPTKAQLTTYGSKIFAKNVADDDACVVRRLKRAGAIQIAKTTTPEFAYSSFTQSPLWGKTLNPWNPKHTPGGSSGGAAVSVVTGSVSFAEGSDMGGSVRIPASFSGCVGLKPSKGRIPMEITATVYDHISHFGPLTRSVEDAAAFLRATEGPLEADMQSQLNPIPLPDRLESNARGLRIAVSADLGFYNVDNAVLHNLERSAAALRDSGAVVDWVDLDWPPEFATDWFDYWCVFLAAQYGHLLKEDRGKLDPELALALERGLALDAATIERGAHSRTRQWHSLAALFEQYDALMCPTTAKVAPLATAKDSDFETLDSNGRLNGLDMTAVFNNVGVCPAVAVPNWSSDEELPTSAQIVARRFDDPTALRIAACLERQVPWPLWSAATQTKPAVAEKN